MKSAGISLILGVLLVFGIVLGPYSGNADEDTIVVFVHKGASVTNMTVAEIKRLFLKERMTLKDGTKAVPVNARSGSRLRQVFVRKVLGMDEAGEKIYWQEQKIKRGLTPPPEFNNTQKAVFSLKGGIGYCFKSEHIPNVNKMVLTL